MQKYNNPRLNGAVISGTGMDHPVRPHVIVGDTSMGYVRGDLVDANVVESVRQSLDYKISNEVNDRSEAVKKIQDQIDTLLGTDATDSAINTIKEIENFLEGYKDTDTLIQKLSDLQGEVVKLSEKKGLKSGYYDKNTNTLNLVLSTSDADETIKIDLSDVLDNDDVVLASSTDIQNIISSSTSNNAQ